MQTVRLNNGVEMPLVGLGTYPMNGPRLVAAVAKAVAAGYRRFDTAAVYGNEAWLGRALKLARPLAHGEAFFLTTKLDSAVPPVRVRETLEASLCRLGIERVDLFLMHWPHPDYYVDQWRQMEELLREGRTRAIGVCNCHPRHLEHLLEKAAVVPAVNQVELHPLLSQVPLRDYCRERGILVEAYSPVARMHPKLIHHPLLIGLAGKHGRTVPQIILRWDIQHGIAVVPKSSRWQGLKENFSLFDFELDRDEMASIDGLNEEFRVRFNPDAYPFVRKKGGCSLSGEGTSRKEILLYGHGGSGNRGCEAIVRSTGALLKKTCGPGIAVRLSSNAPQEDRYADIPSIDVVMDSGSNWPAASPVRWGRAMTWRLLRSPAQRHILSNLRTIRWASRAEVCLSVGGDNYCYDPVEIYYALNRFLRRRCSRMALWGCSIESGRMDKAMLEDLRGFDLITARETLTYAALKDRGIDRVRLYPDPAFTMEEEHLPLPSGWREGQMVGINLSPLIESYERRSGGALDACAELIRHILATTDGGIILIPHVTWRNSDDRYPLGRLYAEFRSDKRVLMLPDGLHAPQIKGYISRCRFFVGARTHATIAAYSTGVPALVLGYSVKAKGIARDLFGSEKGLVLPVQELDDSRQLIQLYSGLVEREADIRSRLAAVLPGCVRAAEDAGQEIRCWLET